MRENEQGFISVTVHTCEQIFLAAKLLRPGGTADFPLHNAAQN